MPAQATITPASITDDLLEALAEDVADQQTDLAALAAEVLQPIANQQQRQTPTPARASGSPPVLNGDLLGEAEPQAVSEPFALDEADDFLGLPAATSDPLDDLFEAMNRNPVTIRKDTRT